MKNKFEQIKEEQGIEAARQYMRDVRAKSLNNKVPFGGRGYFGKLKDEGNTTELKKIAKKSHENSQGESQTESLGSL
jgi:hypothetical protein